MSINEWLERCGAAQQAGSTWPEAALLRAVVDHASWSVSASREDAYAAAAPSGLEALEGLELAAALPAGAACLRLHHAPGAPPLALDAEQVAHLSLFVQIKVVENILSLLYKGAELPLSAPCARLRAFESYFVVQQGAMLVLAPDAHARRLAAAFTAQDALQRFIAAGNASSEERVAARLTGAELFGRLAEAEHLDGVVFNPAGPAQPVPLLKAVAQHVLTAS